MVSNHVRTVGSYCTAVVNAYPPGATTEVYLDLHLGYYTVVQVATMVPAEVPQVLVGPTSSLARSTGIRTTLCSTTCTAAYHLVGSY